MDRTPSTTEIGRLEDQAHVSLEYWAPATVTICLATGEVEARIDEAPLVRGRHAWDTRTSTRVDDVALTEQLFAQAEQTTAWRWPRS